MTPVMLKRVVIADRKSPVTPLLLNSVVFNELLSINSS